MAEQKDGRTGYREDCSSERSMHNASIREKKARQRICLKCGCVHFLAGATADIPTGRRSGRCRDDGNSSGRMLLSISDRARRPQCGAQSLQSEHVCSPQIVMSISAATRIAFLVAHWRLAAGILATATSVGETP